MIILKRLVENEGKAKFTLVKEMGHNSNEYSRISYTKFMKLEDLHFYPSILAQRPSSVTFIRRDGMLCTYSLSSSQYSIDCIPANVAGVVMRYCSFHKLSLGLL